MKRANTFTSSSAQYSFLRTTQPTYHRSFHHDTGTEREREREREKKLTTSGDCENSLMKQATD